MAPPSYSTNLLILLLKISLPIYFLAIPCIANSAATAALQFSSILLAYCFSVKVLKMSVRGENNINHQYTKQRPRGTSLSQGTQLCWLQLDTLF